MPGTLGKPYEMPRIEPGSQVPSFIFSFFFLGVWGYTGKFQGMLLALCSGLIPGRRPQAVVLCKCLTPSFCSSLSLSPPVYQRRSYWDFREQVLAFLQWTECDNQSQIQPEHCAGEPAVLFLLPSLPPPPPCGLIFYLQGLLSLC